MPYRMEHGAYSVLFFELLGVGAVLRDGSIWEDQLGES